MVPSGFQHIVGLGNFPLDWIVKSADELTSKITKGTTPPKVEIVESSSIPFLRVNNLGFTGVLNPLSEKLFVTKEAHEGFLARSVAFPGDILMNIVGPPLGKIAMLGSQYDEYNMNQAIVIYRCNTELVDKFYFLKFLSSDFAQQWLQSRSKKTSGQQNLTIQLCKELPVPVPPLMEQRKIAKILSTWDKAISTTEALIDNSKQQKKGLMQQLLTGNKRLLSATGASFEGEWKEVKLSDAVTIGRGFAFKSSQYSNYGYKIVRVTNIDSSGKIDLKGCVFIPDQIAHDFKKYELEVEDILLVMVGATAGKLGYVTSHTLPALLNQNMWSLRTKDTSSVYQLFLKHLASKIVARYMLSQQGSARGFFTQSTFETVKFHLPPIEEQQKITSVLTNADKEIELLEQQLADLKQEKKALMQQLLTGKRRVKVAEQTMNKALAC